MYQNRIEAKIVTCDLIMHYQILVELDQNLQPNLHTIYNELYHSFLDEFLGQYSSTLQEDVAIIQTVCDSRAIKGHSFMPINP